MTENKPLIGQHAVVLDDIEKWKTVARENLIHYGCNNIIYFENKGNIIKTYESGNMLEPDIALLDMNLNPQNAQNKQGLEVCQFFHDTSPSTTIVVMSSLEDMANQAKRNGADFFIRKSQFIQDFDTFIQQYTKA